MTPGGVVTEAVTYELSRFDGEVESMREPGVERGECVFGKQSWVERAGGCGGCHIAWLLLVHPSVLASMGRGSLGVGGPRRGRDRQEELSSPALALDLDLDLGLIA